jgi:hypothetical protein
MKEMHIMSNPVTNTVVNQLQSENQALLQTCNQPAFMSGICRSLKWQQIEKGLVLVLARSPGAWLFIDFNPLDEFMWHQPYQKSYN